MEIIPLGAGFAAQLRGVTLAEIAADDAAYARGDRGALGPCLLRTRMMGGDVTVTREPGKVSMFTVRLPVQRLGRRVGLCISGLYGPTWPARVIGKARH
jgi:hypothetical protein